MNDIYAEHPWLKESGEASDKPIDSAVIFRMKQFRAMYKLKKLALKVSLRDWDSLTMGLISSANTRCDDKRTDLDHTLVIMDIDMSKYSLT